MASIPLVQLKTTTNLVYPSMPGFVAGKNLLDKLTETTEFPNALPYDLLVAWIISQSLYDRVNCSVDKGKAVDVIHLEFSKALDTPSNSIPMYKLSAHGLDGCSLLGKNLPGEWQWMEQKAAGGWSQVVCAGAVSIQCLDPWSGGGEVLSGSLQVTPSCRWLQAGCDSKEWWSAGG